MDSALRHLWCDVSHHHFFHLLYNSIFTREKFENCFILPKFISKGFVLCYFWVQWCSKICWIVSLLSAGTKSLVIKSLSEADIRFIYGSNLQILYGQKNSWAIGFSIEFSCHLARQRVEDPKPLYIEAHLMTIYHIFNHNLLI